MYASMRACFASQDPSELFPGTFPGDSDVGGTGNERCSSRNRGPTSIQRSDSQAAHGRTTSGSGHVVGRSFEPLADGVAGKANTPALAGRGVGLRYHEDRFGLFAQLNSDSAIPGGWRQRLTRRSRSFFGAGLTTPPEVRPQVAQPQELGAPRDTLVCSRGQVHHPCPQLDPRTQDPSEPEGS